MKKSLLALLLLRTARQTPQQAESVRQLEIILDEGLISAKTFDNTDATR